jgi:hypothetical protein
MRLLGNGRYSLVRELGRGGMGVVWLANDTTLGRDVAVKELMVPGGIPAHERDIYQERVLREARIASRLTDAGLVTIHDLIRENGEMYIVMELIKAPTLVEFVEEHRPDAAPPGRQARRPAAGRLGGGPRRRGRAPGRQARQRDGAGQGLGQADRLRDRTVL